MKNFFYLLLISNLIACNDTSEATTSETTDVKQVIPEDDVIKHDADATGCYIKIVGRDTAILMVEQKGNVISGKMIYDNYEKDGSQGTVKGKEEKEIIKLWYDFNSEGMHSVMEVYFKKENGKLLRGIGDMDVKADTTYFLSGVNYSDKEAFIKVDCELIKWKLKF